MIRFLGSGPTIGLGLSRENVNRLIKGQPIVVPLKSVNFQEKGQIFIFFGETEQEMGKMLIDHGYITPQTKVTKEARDMADGVNRGSEEAPSSENSGADKDPGGTDQ